MTYPTFNPALPNGAAPDLQTGPQVTQSVRDNQRVLRDAAILGGGFFGWPMTPSGGSASQPAVLTYSNGTERVKAALTWGSSGGAAGSVTVAAYSYSSNSGGAYEAIGIKTITYDASANVSGTSWS